MFLLAFSLLWTSGVSVLSTEEVNSESNYNQGLNAQHTFIYNWKALKTIYRKATVAPKSYENDKGEDDAVKKMVNQTITPVQGTQHKLKQTPDFRLASSI
jgi:hypothetical protein